MFKIGDAVRFIYDDAPVVVYRVRKVGECTLDVANAEVEFSSHINNFAHVDVTPTLIAFAGRKGHGKDTAAQALNGYENVKFAGALKEMVRAFLRYVGVGPGTIDRMIDGDLKEAPCEHFGGKSTRYVMQTLGTEWGRNMVWDEIWINAFGSRSMLFEQVVCTDLRFPNEAAVIQKKGGLTIRVRDPRKQPSGDEHPSETLIDTLPVDHEVSNDGSIEALHAKIIAIVNGA